METKTLAYLNSKAWYRLLKVIYILSFLVVLAITSYSVFENNKRRFDNQNSYILCNDGRKVYIKDTSVYIYSDGSIPFGADPQFRRLCLSDKDIGEIAKKTYPQSYQDYTDEVLGKTIRDKKQDFIDKINVDTVNFKFTPIYKERSWLKIFTGCLLGGVIIFLIFEIFRRVFYYIVLGKFIPKKTE